jgi:type IV pilus assembly protein PilO
MKQSVLELYQRKKNWLIAIGLLLLLNIFSFAGIALFQQPALDLKKGMVTEQRKGLDAMAGGDATAIYRKGKSDLEKIQAMIPPKRRFASLLGEIMDSATVCHVSSDSLTYKPEYLRERKLLAYRVSLSVSGRYAALRCFLYEMQTRKELVVVDGITLKNGDPYAEKVSMELKLTVYLRDDA